MRFANKFIFLFVYYYALFCCLYILCSSCWFMINFAYIILMGLLHIESRAKTLLK